MSRKAKAKKIRVCLCEFCVMARQIVNLPTEVLYYMDEADVSKHQCYICQQPSEKLLICNIDEKGR